MSHVLGGGAAAAAEEVTGGGDTAGGGGGVVVTGGEGKEDDIVILFVATGAEGAVAVSILPVWIPNSESQDDTAMLYSSG